MGEQRFLKYQFNCNAWLNCVQKFTPNHCLSSCTTMLQVAKKYTGGYCIKFKIDLKTLGCRPRVNESLWVFGLKPGQLNYILAYNQKIFDIIKPPFTQKFNYEFVSDRLTQQCPCWQPWKFYAIWIIQLDYIIKTGNVGPQHRPSKYQHICNQMLANIRKITMKTPRIAPM